MCEGRKPVVGSKGPYHGSSAQSDPEQGAWSSIKDMLTRIVNTNPSLSKWEPVNDSASGSQVGA